MCPAIHINSRSWLRSSSTHEPSDPPLRVVFFSSRFSTARVGETRRRLRQQPKLFGGSVQTVRVFEKAKTPCPSGRRASGRSPLSPQRTPRRGDAAGTLRLAVGRRSRDGGALRLTCLTLFVVVVVVAANVFTDGQTLGRERSFGNDPSAGSPTETLLRLLLPLNDQVRSTFRQTTAAGCPTRRDQSVDLTKPFNR